MRKSKKMNKVGNIVMCIFIAMTSLHLGAFRVKAGSAMDVPNFNTAFLANGANIYMGSDKYQSVNGDSLLAATSKVGKVKGIDANTALANDKANRAFTDAEKAVISNYGLPSDAQITGITNNPNLYDKSPEGFWGANTKSQQFINTETRKFINGNNAFSTETYNYQGKWPNGGELYTETMDHGYAINGDVTTMPVYKDWIYKTRDQSKLVNVNVHSIIFWSNQYNDYIPGLGGPETIVSHTEIFAYPNREGATVNDPNGDARVGNYRFGVYDASKDAIRNLIKGEELPIGAMTGMLLVPNSYLKGWTAPGFKRGISDTWVDDYLEAWAISFDKSHTYKVNNSVGQIKFPGYQIASTDQNGQRVAAPQKSLRPIFNIDTSRIAYTMPASEANAYTISSTLTSGIPLSSAAIGANHKLSIKDANSGITSIETDKLLGITYDKDTKTLYVPKGTKEINLPFVTKGTNNYISAMAYDKSDKAKFGKIGNITDNKADVVIDLSTLMDTDTLGTARNIAFYTEQANGANQSNTISETPLNISVRVVESQAIDFSQDTKNLLATNTYKYGDSFTLHAEVTKAATAGDPLDQPITFDLPNEYFRQIGTTFWNSVTGKASATFEVIKPISMGGDTNIAINKAATKDASGIVIATSAKEKKLSISTRKRKISLSADPQSFSYGQALPVLPYTITSNEPGEEAIINVDHVPYKLETTHLVGDLAQHTIPVDTDGKILMTASGNIWRLDIIDNGDTSEFNDKYEIMDKKSALLDISEHKGENTANKEKIIADDFVMSISDYEKDKDNDVVLKKKLKQNAKARAINTLDYSEVDIDNVTHNLMAKAGLYHVAFATAKNTQIIVNARLWDYVYEDPSTKERITGNDIHISTTEALSLKGTSQKVSDRVKQLGGLKAISLESGKDVVLTMRSNKIVEKKGSYDITFETPSGTLLEIKAYVYDDGIEDGLPKERIVANDIYISTMEAEHLIGVDSAVSNELVRLAKAKAINTDTYEALAVTIKSNTVIAEKGTYEVIYTTANGTEVIGKVYVSNYVEESTVTNERMSGNDIQISIAEAENLKDMSDTTLYSLIKLGNIHAYRLEDGKDLNVKFVKNDIQAVKGSYEVIFTTDKGTVLSIKAYVRDKAIEDNTRDERISANHIYISIEEASALRGVDEPVSAQLITLAQAAAYDTNTNSAIGLNVKSNTIEAKKGTYEIIFSTIKGTEVSVHAYVSEHMEENAITNERISGNDIRISKAEAENLNDMSQTTLNRLMKLGNIYAYRLEDGKAVDIQLLKNEIQAIKGSYEVNFTTDKGTTLQVKAYVSDESTDDTINKERITANNVYISVEEANSLIGVDAGVSDQLVALAQASAYDVMTNNSVNVSVKSNSIKAEKGTYEVVFTTEKGTIVHVDVLVSEYVEEDTLTKERMSGNDIRISKAEAENLIGLGEATANRLVELGSVYAYRFEDGKSVKVKVLKNDIQPIKGTYEITFTTAKGTILKVMAYVHDEVTEDTTNQERLSVNDVYISMEEAKDLTGIDSATSDRLVTLSQATAYDLSTNNSLRVIVKTNNIKAKKGAYKVVYTTMKGTEVSANAFVSEYVEEDGTTHERMSGNDIYISKEEAENLMGLSTSTSSQLAKLGSIYAYRLENGQSVAVTLFKNDIQAEKGAYEINYRTDAGSVLRVNVYVRDKAVEDSTLKERITANNVYISIDEAKDLMGVDPVVSERLVILGQAMAYDTDTNMAVNVLIKRNSISTKKGVYEIVYTTAKGTEIAVNAYVTDYSEEDSTTQERIVANDIHISTEDAKFMMGTGKEALSRLITLADAKAYSLQTGGSLPIFIRENKIKSERGTYRVTFTSEKGTAVTIKAYVKENETIDKDKKEKITANNFRVSLAEAENLIGTSQTVENTLIQLSSAKAIDLISGNTLTVKLKANALKAKKGAYDVIFTTDRGVEVTATGYVTDEGKEDTTNKERITANDFAISLEEAKLLKGSDVDTTSELILRSNARAYSTITDEAITIQLGKNDIVEQKGLFDVVFTTAKGTSITVQAKVYDYAEDDYQNNERIAGNDIYLSKQEALQLLGKDDEVSKKLVALTETKAYSTVTGADVEVRVSENTLQAEKGNYAITLSTIKGTSIIVHAHVSDSSKTDEDINYEKIIGNNIHLSLADAKRLQGIDKTISDELVDRGIVKAFELKNGNPIHVSVIENKIMAQRGSYNIIFGTEKGTHITLQAIVKDEGSSQNHSEQIYANNFGVSSEEVKTLRDEDIIRMAKAYAYQTETGATIVVKVKKNDIKAERGMYTVIFTTGKTDVHIQVIVKDKGYDDKESNEYISANDFYLQASEVNTISDEELIQLAKATAVDNTFGAYVPIAVNKQKLSAIKGIYDVEFVTAKGTRVVVKATVKDNGFNNPITKEKIVGNDINIDLSEYDRYVNSDMIFQLAQVEASNLSTGAIISNIQVDFSGIKKNIGIYEVYFITEAGTKLTINAIITDKLNLLAKGKQLNLYDNISIRNITDSKNKKWRTDKIKKSNYPTSNSSGNSNDNHCYSHFMMLLLIIVYFTYVWARLNENKKEETNADK